MGVGLRLKECLRENHMTIKELAEISGISKNTLYAITKRDPQKVDNFTIGVIARILDVPPTRLLFDPLPSDLQPLYNQIKEEKEREKLLNAAFKNLNEIGQQKAVEQVSDLAKIPDYQKPNPPK